MSADAVAMSLLPLLFVLVLLLECSRLRCVCVAQRRHLQRRGTVSAEKREAMTDPAPLVRVSPFGD